MSIPANEIVAINPSVLGGGGAAVSLTGLMLTNNTAVPMGTVMAFANQAAVAAFFGSSSTEATLANNYFLGYDNSTAKPGNLLFSQYAAAPVAGYLRGASLASLTLTQLKALAASTITITVDGVQKISSSINLSAATSFSNAATLIQAAFTSPNFVVSYDAQRAAFVFTSSTTGVASSATVATGTLADSLKLSATTGAVVSPGAIASVPGSALDAVVIQARNWVCLMTIFEPVLADKLLFAAWVNASNNRYMYAAWDTDVTNGTTANNSAGFGAQVTAAGYSGVAPLYGGAAYAAFVLGTAASIDFARTNARITTAFKTQSGLVASVTDSTTAANLRSNGYNYYGQYANATDINSYFYPGTISGAFKYIDPYLNEIQLNSALQSAVVGLLLSSPSIPYNLSGKALVEAACQGPITAALNFGSIRPGVALSALQIAQVNAAAGTQIDTVLSSRGWYMQVLDATPTVRAARGSFPTTLWYMDGGSLHSFTMASIAVQ